MRSLRFNTLLAAGVWFLFSSMMAGAETNFDFFFKDTDQYQDVLVQEVVSADTITIENYLKKGERIKFIGLKAPEPPKEVRHVERDEHGFEVTGPIDPADPIEQEALAFAKELLEGKRVRLEFDTNRKDDNLITLAYVFLRNDGTFVNAEILRRGYASLSINPPNVKYAQELREAYKEAKRELRGLQNN